VPVGVITFDLFFPQTHSLKDKRAVVRPVVEGLRRRYRAAASEVCHQELLQRAGITVAVASSSHQVLGETLDAVERFVWSFPELEVLAAARRIVDEDD
jgi:uncharacterized protein YlxP (DUF503 family)